MARLGDALIDQNILSKQQLELALKEQKRTKELLGEIVVRLGFASRKDLSKAVAKSSGLSFVELKGLKIDTSILKTIESHIARKYYLIPFSIVDEVLYVAMDNPNDIRAIDEITRTTGFEVESFAADKEEILGAINLYYDIGESFDDEVEKNVSAALAGGAIAEGEVNPPIVRLVDLFIAEGLRRSATDLHISPEERAVRISFRVDGILQNANILPKKLHPAIVTRIKIIGAMDIAEQRLPQEGAMDFTFMDREVDIRISTSPSTNGENIVLRLLDKGNVALDLEHLGLSGQRKKIIKRLSNLPHGIVLVAGPTGSGKTTTLYSILKEINTFEKNVLTIEDPVEYELHMVKQAQINETAGFTFERAIRHFLRQDPDVILVGEIRDFKTAKTAFQAAMTGHLVLSTIHTNNAVATIARLLDLGVENYFISATIRAIIAQRLVRKLCKACKQEYIPDNAELEYYGLQNWSGAGKKIFKPGKCKLCNDTGYIGRVGIFEILEISPEVSLGITDKVAPAHLEKMAQEKGMETLREAGLKKVLEGTLSLQELSRVTI